MRSYCTFPPVGPLLQRAVASHCDHTVLKVKPQNGKIVCQEPPPHLTMSTGKDSGQTRMDL
jgi:hypothetical protein